MRLFLFLVPLTLFAIGVAGLLGLSDVGSFSSAAEVDGRLAREIDQAFDQNATSAALATAIGFVGIGWTGRSLTRALVMSSALSWRMGGGQRAPARVIGGVIGIVVSTAFVWAVLNRIRANAGLAIASVSFAAVAVVYLVLWTVLLLTLPRATRDPGAVLPGSALIALVITGLQAISQLYLPNSISNSSTIYGALGVTAALLGWYFIIGRTLAFAFSLNAVIYDRYGSISHLVFALPVLRQIPRRVPIVARTFDLPDAEKGDPTGAATRPTDGAGG